MCPIPIAFGVSQGCPLSPFLFSIVMTVLMHDASQAFVAHGLTQDAQIPVSELIYADDTLVVGVSDDFVSKLTIAIQVAGSNYGLAFNWSKLEALPICSDTCLTKPDGSPIPSKDSMVYLGGLLSAAGRSGPELSRRLGMASGDFETLCKVWKHTRLPLDKKVATFDACVVSKLLYCLHTAWFNKAERGKIDAFQARCLRRISGIKHSYISHISNETVLQR